MMRLPPVPQPTLVGHPFSPVGTGRALRVTAAGLRAAGVRPNVRDVWQLHTPEPDQAREIVPLQTGQCGALNIFHINGMEIAATLDRLGGLPPGYNIIQPFWELPRYPAEWAADMAQFDEVWAASRFIAGAISAAVSRPVSHMPLGVEVDIGAWRSRRYFGIPEASFAFLLMFDLKSYVARKNPAAVIACFRRLVAARPRNAVALVVKMQGLAEAEADGREVLSSLAELGSRAVVIDRIMTDGDVAALIACCDATVSLHRSEGFGLSLAEAMHLGVPVIATAWSGNMDFTTADTAALVGYQLVPVPDGAYLHAEDQLWAEPNLDQAAAQMIAFVDDPAAARALGRRGSRHVRVHFCYRASGLRYLDRLRAIAQERPELVLSEA